MVPIELENQTVAIGTTSRPQSFWFHTAWLLMPIGEVIALSLSFDVNTPAVASQPSLIVRWLARSSALIRLGICLGTVIAAVLLPSVALRREFSRLYREASTSRRSWSVLAVHFLAYVVFFWSTGRMLAGMSRSSDQLLPVLLWLGCGLATLGTWLLAAMPVGFWWHILRRGWRVVLAGTVVGLVALAIGQSTGGLWNAFHGTTFRAASAVLRVLHPEVICHPETRDLGTSRFTVNIAPVCSGYEGIGLIWAFLGGYLVLFRRELRFPQALLLLPIGTVVIWMMNVLRIVGLVMVGTWGWPRIALGGFHSQAGWLAFNLVGLGLVAVSRRMGLFARPQHTAESAVEGFTNPTALYLGPLLAVIATTMITGVMSDGIFDRFYAVRVIVAVLTLWFCRRVFQGWTWSCSWFPVGAGVLVFILWLALEPRSAAVSATRPEIPQALRSMSRSSTLFWVAARLLGAVVTVPLIEELAYRGYLLRRLIAADFENVPFTSFTWPSFLISSIVFGVMHQQRWLAGTLAGMLYAFVVRRGGRLSDGVVAHATTNALIAAFVLTTASWSLWT